MKRLPVAFALATLLVPVCFAQQQTRKVVENKSNAVKSARKTAAKDAPAVTTVSSDHFVDVTIAPGQSVALDSGLDYGCCDAVRVSVRSQGNDMCSLQFEAYWTTPDLDLYNATDMVNGNTFTYPNMGAMQFPVYGSQFRLVVTNNGTATVNLMQVLLFAPWTSPVQTPQ